MCPHLWGVCLSRTLDSTLNQGDGGPFDPQGEGYPYQARDRISVNPLSKIEKVLCVCRESVFCCAKEISSLSEQVLIL